MSAPRSAFLPVYLASFRGPLRKMAFRLMLLWLIQAPLTLLAEDEFDYWLVRVVPLLLFVILVVGAYQLMRRRPAAFFTPLPIFLAWSAAVFGFGPLYQWFTPDTASRVSSSIFTSDVGAYAQVALLNTTGLLLTVVGLLIMMRLYLARRKSVPGFLSDNHRLSPIPVPDLRQLFTTQQLLQVAYVALAFAFALRFARYGLNMQLAFPGFLSFLDRAGWVAILFLAIAGGRSGGRVLALAAAIALVEGAIGLMIGIRTEAVAPLVFLFIGYYMGSQSLKGLVVGVLVVTVVLLFITPLVKEIRQLTWSGGYAGGSTGAMREAYVRQMREDGGDDPAGYQVWKRLDYSPWQAAMMDLYDRGIEGNTFRYIFWTFVPRFIAPNKPRFEIGTDIGFAVQGVEQSSSFSGTVYGEMYWNGGWLALVLSSLIYGMLLGAVTAGSLWLFLQATVPAMLIGVSGLLYGLVPDDTFSVSAVGQAIIFLLLLAVYHQSMRFFYPGPTQGGRVHQTA